MIEQPLSSSITSCQGSRVSVEFLDSEKQTVFPMTQHRWNSTVVAADIHMGIDTQFVQTAVD